MTHMRAKTECMLFKPALFILICLAMVNTAHAQEYDIITPENAHGLERVARLGRGYVMQAWFENDHALVVPAIQCYGEATSYDAWRYDTRDLTIPPDIQFDIPMSETVCALLPEHPGFVVDVDNDNHRLTMLDQKRNEMQLQIDYLPQEIIYGYHLSQDGRWLAVVTNNEFTSDSAMLPITHSMKNIGIWDTVSAERVSLIEYYAPQFIMAFSDDGNYFAITARTDVFFNPLRDISTHSDPDKQDGFLTTLYETQTARPITQVDNNLPRSASALAFSPDSSILAVVFFDGRIVLVDTTSGEILHDQHGYAGYVERVQFYQNQIITTSSDGHADFWAMDTFIHQRRDDDCYLIGIDIDDGMGFCRSQNDDWAHLPNTQAPASLLDLETQEHMLLDHSQLNDTWLASVVFSPDDRYLLTISATFPSFVWDAQTYEQIAELNTYFMDDLIYVDDAPYIFANNDGVVWDAETFEEVVRLPVDADINTRSALSEDGDWLAIPSRVMHNDNRTTAPDNFDLKIWRLSDLYDDFGTEPIVEIVGYGEAVLAASPDGRLLAVGLANEVVLVEMATFTEVHRFQARGREIQFSPDGRYLVVADGYPYCCGSADESLRIGYAEVWAVPE
jgi:WD40 repeat protein